MMYQATSFREIESRESRPEKIIKELNGCRRDDCEKIEFEENIKDNLKKVAKNDKSFMTEAALKALMKAYTAQACYYKIGLRFN